MAYNISNAAAKVVNLAGGTVAAGVDIEGGYFSIDNLTNIPAHANVLGALCYCTGDAKFYQYNGTNWVEKKIGATSLADLTTDANHRTVTDTDKQAWNAAAQHVSKNGIHVTSDDKEKIYSAYNHSLSKHASSDAQSNIIERIIVNKTELYPTDKVINITVPTQASDINALPNTTTLADLTTDETHRLVTDDEKEAWNAKLDTTDIPGWAMNTTKPAYTAEEVGALPSNTPIPSMLSELGEDGDHMTVTFDEKAVWGAKQDAITDLNKLDVNKISGLSNVATSGNYDDLTNKPTLGSLAAKSTVSKSDLDSSVQVSLGKADTALQSFTEEDPTVPSHVKSITTTNISNWGTAYTHSQAAHAPSDAEKNVQSDWNVTDTSSDAFIKNKPTIPTTLKNPKALSIGGKSYDGSSVVSVTAADLGIANAIHFIGETTTALTDGATTAAVTIDGASKTPTSGDVVLYSSKEFIWNGSAWKELGDGSSHALKTVTITAGNGLTGGGDISTNRTLNVGAGEGITVNADNVAHSVPSGAAAEAKGSTASRTYVKTVTTDKFGHVTGVTTGTETVTDTNQTILANGTAFGANDAINIIGGGSVKVIPAGTDIYIASSAPTSVEIVGDGNVITDAQIDGSTNKLILTKGTDTNTTYDLSAPANQTNGNVTIDLTAGGSGSGTDSVKIQGTGVTTVSTDDGGVITVNTPTLDNAAVVEALGYTPADDAKLKWLGLSYDESTNTVTFE